MVQPPVTFAVGSEYKLLIDSKITTVRIEKINRDDGGRTYIMFTRPNKRKLFGTETVSCAAEEFKQRCLESTLSEVTI